MRLNVFKRRERTKKTRNWIQRRHCLETSGVAHLFANITFMSRSTAAILPNSRQICRRILVAPGLFRARPNLWRKIGNELYRPPAHDVKTVNLEDNFNFRHATERKMNENYIVYKHLSFTKGMSARGLLARLIAHPQFPPTKIQVGKKWRETA